MASISVLSRLGWAFVAWLLLLPSATVAGAQTLVVQQIGDLRGRIAEAVAAEVTVVPLSPRLDARTTPIILATGKAFLARDGSRVLGLRPAERRAIRQAYDAGQVILLLDASTHDIEALHVLLDDGVAHESATDPVVLAYALRQENRIPTARLVTHPSDPLVGGDLEDDLVEADLASSRTLEIVVEELTRPPAAPEDDDMAGDFPNWGDSPVQRVAIESTDRGFYQTRVDLFALHSCQENMDHYLVNTNDGWLPLEAGYESASRDQGEISLDSNLNLRIDWQPHDGHCVGGIAIYCGIGGCDARICRYKDYPLFYEIGIAPPPEPTAVRTNAAAPELGPFFKSNLVQQGFAFTIAGPVNVSGNGPSSGIQPGVLWDNGGPLFFTRVPPLVREGVLDAAGFRTRYRYCTAGNFARDCTPTILMTGASGACRQFVVGAPEIGQTRPSPDHLDSEHDFIEVLQTIWWEVDPGTYTGSTFDITVTWQAELATSTSRLWYGHFADPERLGRGPTGNCNNFGCSCDIDSQSMPVKVSHTFKVPIPSTQCSP